MPRPPMLPPGLPGPRPRPTPPPEPEPGPVTGDDEEESEASGDCFFPAGCRWIDGCNAESVCIGRDY